MNSNVSIYYSIVQSGAKPKSAMIRDFSLVFSKFIKIAQNSVLGIL